MKEHQKKAIEALSIVGELFEAHSIPYFLLAGTTLGAVREKGMIAWDDDIDIGVFYEDEERVAEILSTNLKNGYKWIDRHCNPNYAKLHGKIIYNDACVIDIFPLVRTSDNGLLRRIQWMERKVLSNNESQETWNKLYKQVFKACFCRKVKASSFESVINILFRFIY